MGGFPLLGSGSCVARPIRYNTNPCNFEFLVKMMSANEEPAYPGDSCERNILKEKQSVKQNMGLVEGVSLPQSTWFAATDEKRREQGSFDQEVVF